MESGATKKVENKNTFVYAFKQQIMKAWQPVPTIHSTICLFTILGNIIFIEKIKNLVKYTVQKKSSQYIKVNFKHQILKKIKNQKEYQIYFVSYSL